MAADSVTCPNCKAKLKLPGSAGGKRIRCPKCDEPFTPAAQEKPLPRAKLIQPKRRDTYDDDDDDDDRDLPRRKKSRNQGINPLILWGSIGGGLAVLLLAGAIIAVVVIVSSNKGSSSVAQSSSSQTGSVDDPTEVRAAAADLRQILIAFNNFDAQVTHLPQANQNGLSWRVQICPFMDEFGALPQSNDWSDAKLLNARPKVFGTGTQDATSTRWRVFTGKDTIFETGRGMSLAQIENGTAFTILVVEAPNPVPWSKPEDFVFDPDKPLPKLGGRFKEGFLAGMADGHVLMIPYDTDEKILKQIIRRNGGQVAKLPGHSPYRD